MLRVSPPSLFPLVALRLWSDVRRRVQPAAWHREGAGTRHGFHLPRSEPGFNTDVERPRPCTARLSVSISARASAPGANQSILPVRSGMPNGACYGGGTPGDVRVLEGHAFIVEAAVSLGGRDLRPGLNIYRFANRIPLLFEVHPPGLRHQPHPALAFTAWLGCRLLWE